MAPQPTAKSFSKAKKQPNNSDFHCAFVRNHAWWAGASIIYDPSDFDEALTRGLHLNPIHEVMIDKAVMGWKEYELELLRDSNDNVTIICSIPNFDPMGIHTGDSITVAPAMTLSDTTFSACATWPSA